MADDIDYDELDQALRGAIRHEKQTRASKATTNNKTSAIKKALNKSKEAANSTTSTQKRSSSSKARSVTSKSANNSQSVPIRRSTPPRGHYMDMVGATTTVKYQRATISARPVRKPSSAKVTTQTRRVATANPSSIAARPKRTVQQQKPIVPISYPESTITPETQPPLPQSYASAAAPQVANVAPTPAAPIAPNPPAVQNVPSTPAVQQNISSTPMPNETPLGARSPYMINNAAVDKRPLSNDVKEGLSEVYSGENDTQKETLPPERQSRTNKKSNTKKPQEKKKKETEESSHDWKWTLTMLIVIIAGAVAGYLFYILFADKLPF
jgi:hypothetical protein